MKTMTLYVHTSLIKLEELPAQDLLPEGTADGAKAAKTFTEEPGTIQVRLFEGEGDFHKIVGEFDGSPEWEDEKVEEGHMATRLYPDRIKLAV